MDAVVDQVALPVVDLPIPAVPDVAFRCRRGQSLRGEQVTPSSSSVRLARRTRGGLNSGTPLAIASTPVSALQPAENAFSNSSRPTGSIARAGSNERLSGAACSASGWSRPMARMASSPTMKTIVGSRNARAA
jgi:hypothetical protein